LEKIEDYIYDWNKERLNFVDADSLRIFCIVRFWGYKDTIVPVTEKANWIRPLVDSICFHRLGYQDVVVASTRQQVLDVSEIDEVQMIYSYYEPVPVKRARSMPGLGP